MSISLRQLKYFVTASEAGQISRAAVEVGISQSAITEAVQSLELETGVKLLERTSGGVRPTPEGYQFLYHARKILADVAHALHTVKGPADRAVGPLRIGASSTVTGLFLPAPLARFRRAFPEADVTIIEAEDTVVMDRILAGEMDIGLLVISNFSISKEFVSHSLISYRRRLWTCPDHPFASRKKVAMIDIAKEPYIQLVNDGTDIAAEKFWAPVGIKPKDVFETTSTECLRGMVAHGQGLTVTSDIIYRPWSVDGARIEAIEIADPIPPLQLGVLHARGAEPEGAAKAFVDFLLRERKNREDGR